MGQLTKDEQLRARLREYEQRLANARETVTVLARFARAREMRGRGGALEVAFAAAARPDAPALPASVWVGLRQDDVEAVLETLTQHACERFLIAEREQLDAGYRLTAVAECRDLPNLELLITQLAAFLDVPADVVAMVSGWGPDDPRTTAEIERLMDQRHPSCTPGPVPSAPESTPAGETPIAPVDPVAPVAPIASGLPIAASTSARATLAMSSAELIALLALTPEQQGVLGTLVRQADLIVCLPADD